MRLIHLLLLLGSVLHSAEPEFPLTADSQVQANVPKGMMIKDSYKARDGSVFPGTEREYEIYLPAGHDKTKPAAFMVFQDGVIYQAPVVFDNLIAKKEVPPLVGIFIKPGVAPAANENALPRYNRSYEYDSITPTYSEFLIDEFLPAIESKHGIKLSTDPNHAAISGNSSGGICAFMVAWHRPDRFRRVFTGVGTYVGIHGADQLPVLVRKFEPKPLRIFLQSGTGDNNLYCGDWWMANQMMERSLTWAGYDVNHAWGEGGHNQKHASQIFPEVLRWLWRDWQTTMEVKANPRGDSKWRGYEVVGDGEWEAVIKDGAGLRSMASAQSGEVFAINSSNGKWWRISRQFKASVFSEGHISDDHGLPISRFVFGSNSKLYGTGSNNRDGISEIKLDGTTAPSDMSGGISGWSLCAAKDRWYYMGKMFTNEVYSFRGPKEGVPFTEPLCSEVQRQIYALALSPDQTQLFATCDDSDEVFSYRITADHRLADPQPYFLLDAGTGKTAEARGLCVDTNGWLYVATHLGVQICDQAGRVNFIIPTPTPAIDVCFGGMELSDLFVACGDTIYKRPTKAKGVVSGQDVPIKPAAPKL